jgi:hypothetical protein
MRLYDYLNEINDLPAMTGWRWSLDCQVQNPSSRRNFQTFWESGNLRIQMIRHAKYCSAVHGTLDAINAKRECIAFWLEDVYRQKYKKRERESNRERERENGSMDFAFVEKEEKEEQKSV